jgi:hypothetical protein
VGWRLAKLDAHPPPDLVMPHAMTAAVAVLILSIPLLPQGQPGAEQGASWAATADPMDKLRYFVGVWLATAEDPRTGSSFTLYYEVKPALDEQWLTGYGESPELGVSIQDFWGIDPVSGELVRVIFDSQGTFGTVRSKGWEGDTLFFDGETQTPNGAIPVRLTITRHGHNAFQAVWEALLDEGWTTYAVEQLRRESAE